MASPLIVCSSHSDPAVILSPCLVVLTLPAVDLLHVIEIVLELIQETGGGMGGEVAVCHPTSVLAREISFTLSFFPPLYNVTE